MKNYSTTILANHEISPGYFRMKLLAPGIKAQTQPGQFIMIRPQTGLPTMLRRPLASCAAASSPPNATACLNASTWRSFTKSSARGRPS